MLQLIQFEKNMIRVLNPIYILANFKGDLYCQSQDRYNIVLEYIAKLY